MWQKDPIVAATSLLLGLICKTNLALLAIAKYFSPAGPKMNGTIITGSNSQNKLPVLNLAKKENCSPSLPWLDQ
jgi:hypothetical protein